MADAFAPPPQDEHDHRQKTPDCKVHETPEERAASDHADCERDHVCNLYRDHFGRHRSKKCYHYFGPDPDAPEPDRWTCNCGSVDKHGDDLGEHSPTCPYHLAAIRKFGSLPPREQWTGTPQHPDTRRPLAAEDGPAQAIADEINATGGVVLDGAPSEAWAQLGRAKIDPVVVSVTPVVDAAATPPHAHRWAWLTAGGQECVDCGARR